MNLICFQGHDKENWAQLNALIKRGTWDKILIVKNKETESFTESENCIVLEINSNSPILELKDEIRQKLKAAIGRDFEVALSIASGNGKEHMALISALLSIPMGIRFIAYTKNGIEFIN